MEDIYDFGIIIVLICVFTYYVYVFMVAKQ